MAISKIGLVTQSDWDETWPKVFGRYQQDLRHAYYVNSVLDSDDISVLEIGAGSYRDMALLNRLGVNCWGCDFSSTSVELARSQFPELSQKIFQADAFNLEALPDKRFSASFHNGLWILFDDSQISRLVREQARVSNRKIIATVHNKHNKDFVSYFERMAENDPLYKIRFFEVDEVVGLMRDVCREVFVIPVGKGKKSHEDEYVIRGMCAREELFSFFRRVKLDNLNISERLLCVGRL